jgi:hypothetical protein
LDESSGRRHAPPVQMSCPSLYEPVLPQAVVKEFGR